MGMTKIEYLTKVWNPTSGCLPDFPCWERCWARNWHVRFRGGDFSPKFHSERLDEPLKWKKSQRVGVSFMGDMFCDGIDATEINQVLNWAWEYNQHKFLVLTKRIKRIVDDYDPIYKQNNSITCFGDNIWLGTSISTQADADERIPQLIATGHQNLWLSVEPLLNSIKLKDEWLSHIHFCVVGGETGKQSRICNPVWIWDIWWRCKDIGVPFYFKQWGGKCDLSGLDFNTAEIANTRQFPSSLLLPQEANDASK